MGIAVERSLEPDSPSSGPKTIGIQNDPRAIHIAIVQDHDLVREGVRRTLLDDRRFEIVGEAITANEALALLAWKTPDVVILDVRLRHGTSIDVCRELAAHRIETRVLVLTEDSDDESLESLFALGVSGFLSKSASTHELKQTVLDLMRGRVVLPGTTANRLRRTMAGHRRAADSLSNGWPMLTRREGEVLRYLGQGLRNAEIARAMEISCRTVETHVRNVLAKLGVKSRSQAAVLAVERGRSWEPAR